jgi:O-antigen/teichoic acid export membrane protein
VFADALSRYVGISGAAFMFAVVFCFETTYQTLEQLLTGRGRVGLAGWLDTVRSYLTLAAQMSLVLLGFGAGGIVYGVAIASGLVVPVTFSHLKSDISIPTRRTVHNLWTYAQHSIVQNILLTGYITGGILILTLFYSTRVAGFYEIARIVATPAFMISSVIGTGVLTKVSSRGPDSVAVIEDIQNSLAFSSIVSLPLFFGTLALSREVVVTVYGSEYAAAAPFLVLMTAFYVLWTQVDVLGQAINGLDRPNIAVCILAVASVVAIMVMAVCIQFVGPLAVIVALIAGEVVRYVGSVAYIRQEFPEFVPVSRPQVEQALSAFLMLGVVVIAQSSVPVRWWGDLLILVGGGAAVYFGVLLSISAQTRDTLQTALREI